MTKLQEVKQMAERLQELFPGGLVGLNVPSYDGGLPELSIHGASKTYAQASALMRALGIGKRTKQISGNGAWTNLTGEADGVQVRTYPDELPPTCHKEKYIERVPKTQTVETGEFVEIERERVICNGADDQPAPESATEAHAA